MKHFCWGYGGLKMADGATEGETLRLWYKTTTFNVGPIKTVSQQGRDGPNENISASKGRGPGPTGVYAGGVPQKRGRKRSHEDQVSKGRQKYPFRAV